MRTMTVTSKGSHGPSASPCPCLGPGTTIRIVGAHPDRVARVNLLSGLVPRCARRGRPSRLSLSPGRRRRSRTVGDDRSRGPEQHSCAAKRPGASSFRALQAGCWVWSDNNRKETVLLWALPASHRGGRSNRNKELLTPRNCAATRARGIASGSRGKAAMFARWGR